MPLQACIPDTTPSTGISLLRCPYFCARRAISSPSVELERRGQWRRRTSQTRQLVTVDFLPDSLSTYLCRTVLVQPSWTRAMTITRSSAGNRLVPKEPGKKNKVLEQLGNAQDRPPFHFSVMGPVA